MDNVFITQHFDWDATSSRKLRLVNKLLSRIGMSAQLTPTFTGYMTTIEQRINLFHLLSQVLAYGVPGDIVEVGTHEGVTAALFMKVMARLDPGRSLHLFDAFENPPVSAVLGHFERLGLPTPVVRAGWLHETLPANLPPRVAFFSIDLGPGRFAEALGEDVLLALSTLYPRMAPGAVGVLQDYCDPTIYDQPGHHFPELIRSTKYWNLYPQVKWACDAFFGDKPERVHPLFGGNYSHGYFRKATGSTTIRDISHDG